MKAHRRLPAGRLATGMAASRDEAVLNWGGSRSDSVLYDFSVDGGAVGVINFQRVIPAGAVVHSVLLHEIANVTSGGSATLQVLAGATSIVAATAFGSIATGSIALAGSATAIPLAVDSNLTLAIAGAAVTAGKVRIFVRYVMPND